MEVDSIEVVEMELKYCERCGGLWLRPRGNDEVYCESCGPKMAEFPLATKRRAIGLAINDTVLEGCCDDLFAVCCEGGNA
jgi:Zn-finger nucleic acid-binding protein